MDTVTIKQASGFAPLLPKDIPATLNWQPAWYYKFGGTRYFDNGWQVSAGYIYSENAMPDAHYSPLIADSARHWLSIGTGHKGHRFDFDVAYQFGIGDGTRTVSGSAPLATDFSARDSVMRTITPKNPAAANVSHTGKVGERQI